MAKSYKIDTDSISDMSKIIGILRKNNIKFQQSGSIITIMADRNSLKTALLHSQFGKLVGNHWWEI